MGGRFACWGTVPFRSACLGCEPLFGTRLRKGVSRFGAGFGFWGLPCSRGRLLAAEGGVLCIVFVV